MTMKEQEQQAPMANREELTALLDRVRAATGPDRELDCLLWQVAYPDANVMFDAGKAFGPGEKRPATYGRLADFPVNGRWDDWEGLARHIGAEAVTASIDAALALIERVLPGRRWGVASHSIKDGKNERGWPLHHDGFRAHVTERSALRPMPSVADAPAPALAIIAATLSALIAQAETP